MRAMVRRSNWMGHAGSQQTGSRSRVGRRTLGAADAACPHASSVCCPLCHDRARITLTTRHERRRHSARLQPKPAPSVGMVRPRRILDCGALSPSCRNLDWRGARLFLHPCRQNDRRKNPLDRQRCQCRGIVDVRKALPTLCPSMLDAMGTSRI